MWDDYRVEGYLRPGTYRFAETVGIQLEIGSSDVDEFRWGFSLNVECGPT